MLVTLPFSVDTNFPYRVRHCVFQFYLYPTENYSVIKILMGPDSEYTGDTCV